MGLLSPTNDSHGQEAFKEKAVVGESPGIEWETYSGFVSELGMFVWRSNFEPDVSEHLAECCSSTQLWQWGFKVQGFCRLAFKLR